MYTVIKEASKSSQHTKGKHNKQTYIGENCRIQKSTIIDTRKTRRDSRRIKSGGFEVGEGRQSAGYLLLPQLCEVFGVTADALLEVPTSIKKDNVMAGLIEYANEVGSVNSSFEAVKACSPASDTAMEKGSALQAYNGIRICATEGLAFIIDGKAEMQKVLNTDFDNIRKMCALLSDENVIKVLRTFSNRKDTGRM